MNARPLASRLAVCSWSLQPSTPQALLAAVKATDVHRVQLALDKLDRPNIGVNFDPANMVLYDKGDPIDALITLAPWIRQVHIKDGIKTSVPGTWGEEVVAGTGDLCIEREAGGQRVADIVSAREMVEGIEA